MLTEAIRLLEQANNYSIRLQMGEDWCVSVDAVLAAHSAGAQEPEAWLTPGNDLHLENPGYDDWTPLYAHPQPIPQTDAARDVLAERQRQVSVEGWTPEHDDAHDPGVLASAAAAYAGWAADMLYPLSMGDGDRDREGAPPIAWPWDREWWKPVNPRRALEKAAALILAEIERLDRAKGE